MQCRLALKRLHGGGAERTEETVWREGKGRGRTKKKGGEANVVLPVHISPGRLQQQYQARTENNYKFNEIDMVQDKLR